MRRAKKRKLIYPVLLICAATALLAFRAGWIGTYRILDGGSSYVYSGVYLGIPGTLAAAGLRLEPGDTCTAELGQVRQLMVHRASRVEIRYHGESRTVISEGETVARLLERLGLALTGEDELSVPGDACTRDGMVISVDRILREIQTFCISVPYETIVCACGQIPAGQERILRDGTEGELRCTAEVTYRNGIEVSRQILQEEVTVVPGSRILARGTGEPAAVPDPDMPVIRDGYIALPTGELLPYTHTATVRATAYTHTDEGCNRVTATGSMVHVGTVAVDPRYIPYGTRMFIMASDGSYVYGIAQAEDCGGDIKGDRVDLYMPTYDDCIAFGRRVCTVYYLG